MNDRVSDAASGRAIPKLGYWWSEKKSKKINVDEFSEVCKRSGLELVKIDLDRPLEEQGPFAAIVHKLSDHIVRAEQGDSQSLAICDAFEKYVDSHPEVIIFDPIPNVKRLLDRSSQYQLVEDNELQAQGDIFIPAFVKLTTNNVAENLAKMKAADVSFPCVCKPSLSHGSTAHQMSLIFCAEGLKDISPPCVAQKFVNHNAVLYKLYIVGDEHFIIERPSLKNFSAGEHETIFFHSHDISKPHSASKLTELDLSEPKAPTIRPQQRRLQHIVQTLRSRLGLALFGADVIVDIGSGRYAVIDVNIFPGYNEVENFFQLFCDLVLRRISLQAQGLSELRKPGHANSVGWFSSPLASLPENNEGKEKTTTTTMAVIPNSCLCFCCPISGSCSNNREFRFSNLVLSEELSAALRNVVMAKENDEEKRKKRNESEENAKVVSYCSPEDSGIETSDSCDEKKKGSVTRIVKRQHSKTHSATNPEETGSVRFEP